MERLIFAYCTCVKQNTASINVLHQKSFDGVLVHFELECLYCGKKSLIAEDLEGCQSLGVFEKEVMDWLGKEDSWIFLELVMTGKTVSIPQEHKEHENGGWS